MTRHMGTIDLEGSGRDALIKAVYKVNELLDTGLL